MKNISIIIILLLALPLLAMAATSVEKVTFSVTEKNGIYKSHTKATLTGSYDEFVNRVMDFGRYAKMKISYFKDNKIVEKNGSETIVWNKMRSMLMKGEYYLKIHVERGHHRTKIIWHLIPKGEFQYPEDHSYAMLKGGTVVRLLSGNGDQQRFRVDSHFNVKFKPDTLIIKKIAKRRIEKSARRTLEGFIGAEK